MAERLTRWQRADRNFREQFVVLEERSGMTKAQIAQRCGVSTSSCYRYFNSPTAMTKKFERYLTMLFEEYGLHYDPTLGEGVSA